ncbi:MAG: DUF4350 domain-containing protein [Methanomicrobiales archaeon]|nr:DUF4350 domain-containing protein [Methanomicrobiales archaeon]
MNIIRAVTWIAGIVICASVFLLVVHLSANNMEFSRYNAGWNGTSSFFFDLDRHQTIDIRKPGELAGYPGNTTLLIIAPHRAPTTEELAAYSAFLKDGNTIFLADDFGTGNAILAGIGSRITILPGNLSSLDRAYPDPYSVIVYRATEDGPVPLPVSLALNRPAPLEGGSSLMLSSVMSWVDLNGDKRLNLGEGMGTFPVMTTETVGSGRIIVLSDPSIFINSMYSQAENANNREFLKTFASPKGPLLIDQMNSRSADANGFSGILHVLRNTISIELIIIGALLLGTAWAWKKKAI